MSVSLPSIALLAATLESMVEDAVELATELVG